MLHSFSEQVANCHAHFAEILKKIRTGRPHPEMVADILVEAYGAQTPLSGLAGVSVTDARTLVVEPWDKQIVKAIEKAIIAADRNLSCAVSGDVIRLSIPGMTEETRLQVAKSLDTELERARVAVRKAREEEKKQIEAKTKSKELTEDDRRDRIKTLDEETKKAISRLEAASQAKRTEIMKV